MIEEKINNLKLILDTIKGNQKKTSLPTIAPELLAKIGLVGGVLTSIVVIISSAFMNGSIQAPTMLLLLLILGSSITSVLVATELKLRNQLPTKEQFKTIDEESSKVISISNYKKDIISLAKDFLSLNKDSILESELTLIENALKELKLSVIDNNNQEIKLSLADNIEYFENSEVNVLKEIKGAL